MKQDIQDSKNKNTQSRDYSNSINLFLTEKQRQLDENGEMRGIAPQIAPGITHISIAPVEDTED